MELYLRLMLHPQQKESSLLGLGDTYSELKKMKPFYFGFSLYLAFSFSFLHDAAPMIGKAGMSETHLVWYLGIFFAAKTIVFLTCAYASYKNPRLNGEILSISAAMLLAIGFALLTILLRTEGFQLDSSETFLMLIFAGTILGIGDAFMTLLWGRFSSTLSIRSVYLFVLISYVVALLLYMIFVMLPPLALIVCACAGSIFLPFLLKKSIASRPPCNTDKPDSRSIKKSLSAIWRPVFLTAIFAFMSNFAVLISGQQSVDAEAAYFTSIVITLIVVLFMFLPVLLFPKRADIGFAYRIALPLAAGGFLLLAFTWNSGGGVANSMVAMGWLLADLVSWCIIANTAFRTRVSAFILYGIGQAVVCLAALIGIGAGFYFAHTIGFGAIALMTVALVAIYVLSTAIFIILKDRRITLLVEETEAATNVLKGPQSLGTHKDSDSSADTKPTYVIEDRRRLRVQEISEQENLTPRETEILGLLAQGRNTQYMAKTLFLSENTVKSHVKNVYKKLDVHSKQDIIDIINSDQF